jgi:2-oxoglutarate ferredoxin oxidoreductase subunit beta
MGIKLHRPELAVFVVMGDGDCTSIGAAHWIHALRYNPDLTVMMLDNGIYGLTKNQTSPTTPKGVVSNTQPQGSWLPALNPLTVSLGVTNASFIAQTAEFVPAHLFATLRAAYRHKGLAFVRILQRCPIYQPDIHAAAVRKPAIIEMLVHDDGVVVPELDGIYKHVTPHDPGNLEAARRLAEDTSNVKLGVFYRDPSRVCYEELRRVTPRTSSERLQLLNAELDRYAV